MMKKITILSLILFVATLLPNISAAFAADPYEVEYYFGKANQYWYAQYDSSNPYIQFCLLDYCTARHDDDGIVMSGWADGACIKAKNRYTGQYEQVFTFNDIDKTSTRRPEHHPRVALKALANAGYFQVQKENTWKAEFSQNLTLDFENTKSKYGTYNGIYCAFVSLKWIPGAKYVQDDGKIEIIVCNYYEYYSDWSNPDDPTRIYHSGSNYERAYTFTFGKDTYLDISPVADYQGASVTRSENGPVEIRTQLAVDKGMKTQEDARHVKMAPRLWDYVYKFNNDTAIHISRIGWVTTNNLSGYTRAYEDVTVKNGVAILHNFCYSTSSTILRDAVVDARKEPQTVHIYQYRNDGSKYFVQNITWYPGEKYSNQSMHMTSDFSWILPGYSGVENKKSNVSGTTVNMPTLGSTASSGFITGKDNWYAQLKPHSYNELELVTPLHHSTGTDYEYSDGTIVYYKVDGVATRNDLYKYNMQTTPQHGESRVKVRLVAYADYLKVVDASLVAHEMKKGDTLTVWVASPARKYAPHRDSLIVSWMPKQVEGKDISFYADRCFSSSVDKTSLYRGTQEFLNPVIPIPENLDCGRDAEGFSDFDLMRTESNYLFTLGEDKHSVDVLVPLKSYGYWYVSQVRQTSFSIDWNVAGQSAVHNSYDLYSSTYPRSKRVINGIDVDYVTINIPVPGTLLGKRLNPTIEVSTASREPSGKGNWSGRLVSSSPIMVPDQEVVDNPQMPMSTNGNIVMQDTKPTAQSEVDRMMFDLPVFGAAYINASADRSALYWHAPASTDQTPHRVLSFSNQTNCFRDSVLQEEMLVISFTLESGWLVTYNNGHVDTIKADNGPQTVSIQYPAYVNPLTRAAMWHFNWFPGTNVPMAQNLYFYVDMCTTDSRGWHMEKRADIDGVFYTGSSSISTETMLPMPASFNHLYFFDAPQVEAQGSKGDNELNEFVSLKWSTSSEADYYELYRSPAGQEEWNRLDDNDLPAGQMYYLDRSAVPNTLYDYVVKAVVYCSQDKVSSDTIRGAYRSPYARMGGRVIYSNGQSMTGVQIRLKDEEHGYTYTTHTDASGYWMIDTVRYDYEKGSQYEVAVNTTQSAEFYYNGQPASATTVSVNSFACNHTDIQFVNTSYLNISGKVYYEGTTIPSTGVMFYMGLADGSDMHLVTDIEGTPVVTDADGSFSFPIPKGNDFRVRAFKDDHHFVNDGYLHYTINSRETDTIPARTQDLNQVRFYDQTRILLRGRIAGGDDLASLPVGFGLTPNVLGDNLQFVLQLEGDDVSSLIYYEDHPEINRHDTTWSYYGYGKSVHNDTVRTNVHTEYKRIIVHPDSATGEFMLYLPPTRWKVSQVTATGYGSLLPDGITTQVLDLTDSLSQKVEHYNIGGEMQSSIWQALYVVTYHAPVNIVIQQLESGVAKLPYFGEKEITTKDISYAQSKVPLYFEDKQTGKIKYTFGNPLFQSKKTYEMQVSASEIYYYNNDRTRNQAYHNQLKGNKVRIYNGLNDDDANPIETALDSTGKGNVKLYAYNSSFRMSGEDALKAIEVYVMVNGEYVAMRDMVRGYVLADRMVGNDMISHIDSTTYAKRHTDIMIDDVLRNPPGSGSTATISKGTSYTRSFNFDFNIDLGAKITMNAGREESKIFCTTTGSVDGNTGDLSDVKTEGRTVITKETTDVDLNFLMSINKDDTYSYTYSLNSSITTDPSLPGNDGNIFIGSELSARVQSLESFCVIDKQSFDAMGGRTTQGKMRLVQEGLSSDGKPYYLVTTEASTLLPAYKGHFVYTRKHIAEVIIPNLIREASSLLIACSESEAQSRADNTKNIVYRSLVPAADDRFGKKDQYVMVYPNSMDSVSRKSQVDEVAAYKRLIGQWQNVLYRDEETQLKTIETGKPWLVESISAGTSYSFTETASGNESHVFKMNTTALNTLVSGFFGMGVQYLHNGLITDSLKGSSAEYAKLGEIYKFMYTPVVSPTIDYTPTESSAPSRTISVHLENNNGYMTIGVHRTMLVDSLRSKDIDAIRANAFRTAFVGGSRSKDTTIAYADYVYSVMGGATSCPYISKETTTYYRPGATLSEGTRKIQIPKMTVNHREATNVPQDAAATFMLNMWSESELDASLELTANQSYMLSVVDATNPYGLQFTIDGQNIASGRTFNFARVGEILHKTLEVRRPAGSSQIDYENVQLLFSSTCDPSNAVVLPIDIHFVPTSTDVTISSPSDKWVINTNSSFDEANNSYYMPIVISGYDQTWPNFNRIELQYKKSTQSDDDWITQIAYYADKDIYNSANGAKAMLPNGGIVTGLRFFGDRVPMAIEQNYDIRAVSYTRYGNTFVSKSSNIISGMKDTRRPRLFGNITPVNGVLRYGETIHIPFNEPIASNLLQEDLNFRVRSFYSESQLKDNEALQFTGTSGVNAVCEHERVISPAYDFAIDMMIVPETKSSDMALFATGCEQQRVEFGLTRDNELYAVLDTVCYKTDRLNLSIGGFTRVSLSYDALHDEVTIRQNTQPMPVKRSMVPMDNMLPDDKVCHRFVFGSSISGERAYAGKMLNARVWSRQLTDQLLSDTQNKRLSGNVSGLMAYYPMDEGFGNVCRDYANGAHLRLLQGATWSVGEGLSLQLNGGDGIHLNGDLFNRHAEQDFTLAFWFNADAAHTDASALFASGTGKRMGTLYVGINELGYPFIRTAVQGTDTVMIPAEQYADVYVRDGKWHYFILSVNRSEGTAAIYVDDVLSASFPASMVGALSDNEHLYLGACHDFDNNRREKISNRYYGYIDGLTFWASALSKQNIFLYSYMAPLSDELGLLVHAPFEKEVRNSSGIMSLIADMHNHRMTFDQQGFLLAGGENLLHNAEDMKSLSFSQTHAPGSCEIKMKDLDFDWTSRDNELVINIKNADRDINGNYVFISVNNVEDLRGNTMSSVINTIILMERSQLRWDNEDVNENIKQGEHLSFTATLRNIAAMPTRYTIDNLPQWLRVDNPAGIVDGDSYVRLNFTLDEQVGPGEYICIINAEDENGLTVSLPISITISPEKPQWEIDRSTYNTTMNLFGLVKTQDGSRVRIDENNQDIVGAFMDGICVGVESVGQNGKLYMTIYGIADTKEYNTDNKPVQFLLWDASTGQISSLTPSRTIRFRASAIIGTPDEPIELITNNYMVQPVSLSAGWNWVSSYVQPKDIQSVQDAFVPGYPFSDGDRIKCGIRYLEYTDGIAVGTLKTWITKEVYQIKVANAGTLGIIGRRTTPADRTITIRPNRWNSLPYPCTTPMSVNEALAGLYKYAQPGDVVKSYTQFAILNEQHQWVGNLTHLQPGQGYLYKYTGHETFSFTYYDDPALAEIPAAEPVRAEQRITTRGRYEHNMPIVAEVVDMRGKRLMEGTLLSAYDDDNVLLGEAAADEEGMIYLVVSADENTHIHFVINDVEQAMETATYQSGMVIGNYQQPLRINARDEKTRIRKYILDGVMYIERGDKTYTILGNKQ